MNQISKPENSLIDSIIPLVQALSTINDTLDIDDPDNLLEAIEKLKEIKDIVWEIDATYWILLNQSRRENND